MSAWLSATLDAGEKLLNGDEAVRLLAFGRVGVPAIFNPEGALISDFDWGDDPEAKLLRATEEHARLLRLLRSGDVTGYCEIAGTRDLREVPAEYWYLPHADNAELRLVSDSGMREELIRFRRSEVAVFSLPDDAPVTEKRSGRSTPADDDLIRWANEMVKRGIATRVITAPLILASWPGALESCPDVETAQAIVTEISGRRRGRPRKQ